MSIKNIQEIFNKYKNVSIITGGTFGHVNPAIALSLKYNLQVYLESKLCKYYIGINFQSFKFTNKWNLFELFKSTFFFIRKLRKSDAVFLSGAYICLPAFIASILLKKKIFIHEQNSVMGKANKLFSYFAQKIFTSFKKTEPKNKKYICTGFFISKPKFKISEKHIAILSGTNSSPFLDLNITHHIAKFAQKNKLKVYHQAHKSTIVQVKKIYQDIGVKAYVDVKFSDFEKIIAQSKILINRAGAGSIAYALLYKKDPILIPLSWSKDDHQRINAIQSGLTYIEEKNITDFSNVLEKKYLEKNKINGDNFGDFFIQVV